MSNSAAMRGREEGGDANDGGEDEGEAKEGVEVDGAAEVAFTDGAATGGDGDGAESGPGRLSASATALSTPGVCRISEVNSVM
jgi:hypothetical protein